MVLAHLLEILKDEWNGMGAMDVLGIWTMLEVVPWWWMGSSLEILMVHACE